MFKGFQIRRSLPALAVGALALAGCSTSTSSSSSFKGEQGAVANTIGTLQSAATASENKKICQEVFAKANVERLGGLSGCEQAVKSQLDEVSSFELATKAVHIEGTAATATVEAIVSGKKHDQTVHLVKEAAGWRISSLG